MLSLTSGLCCTSFQNGSGVQAPSKARLRAKSAAHKPPPRGRFTQNDIAFDTTPAHSSYDNRKREPPFNLASVIEAPFACSRFIARVYRMPYPKTCQPPVAALFFSQVA